MRVPSSLSVHCTAIVLHLMSACGEPDPTTTAFDEVEPIEPRDRLKTLPPPPPLVPPSRAVKLSGKLEVGDLGDLTYALPLPLPPGRRLAPEISLSYSSLRGDGMLGAGWSLNAGVSVIRYCELTHARDGERRGVRGDGRDRLCLDDQRLIAIRGPYGGNGTEYRTEHDTFARIISFNPDVQPASFEVWTKSGLIKRFGKRPGCKDGSGQPCDAVRLRAADRMIAWYLYQVEDRFGNTIDFEYLQDFNDRGDEAGQYEQTEELLVHRIRYTGHPSTQLQPSREILFDYAGRPDPSYGYYVGGRTSLTRRLERIEVMVDGAPQMRFELSYELGAASGRSRLSSVRQCAETVCGLPTSFVYQDGNDGFDPVEIATAAIAPDPYGPASQPLVADPNGDGRPDLVYELGGKIQIVPALAGGSFGAMVETSISTAIAAPIAAADFNLDGRTDLLTSPSPSPPGAAWRLLISVGDDFYAHDTGIANAAGETRTLDFDGDGRPDLLGCVGGIWTVFLNDDGMTFATSLNLGVPADCSASTLALDLESDGPTEILFGSPGRDRYLAAQYTPRGIELPEIGLPHEDGVEPIFSDFNGDGLLDALVDVDDGVYGRTFVLLNVGGHFRGRAATRPARWSEGFDQGTPDPRVAGLLRQSVTLDYDHDGLTDLLTPMHGGGWLRRKTRKIDVSNGGNQSIFAARELPGIPFSEASDPRPRAMDVDLDGTLDLVLIEAGQLQVHRRTGPRDGLLKEIWVGRAPVAGATPFHSIAYGTLGEAWLYQPGQTCAYPQVCFRGAMSAVGTVFSDGGQHGRELVQVYSYEDLRFDLSGYGLLGFSARTSTLLNTSRRTRLEYYNHERDAVRGGYPLRGAIAFEEVSTPVDAGWIVETRRSDWHVRSIAGVSPDVVVIAPSLAYEEVAEIDPAGTRTMLAYRSEQNSPPDAYGNLTWTEVYDDESILRIDREFSVDPNAWLIDRVSDLTVTHEVYAVGRAVRTMSFRYQVGTNELERAIIEPQDPNLHLELELRRNAHGNVERVTRRDIQGNERTREVRYDDTGTFAFWTKNELGHETLARIDPAFGIQEVAEDANGRITTNHHDRFGIVSRTVAPGGRDLSTQFSLAPASAPHAYEMRSTIAGGGEETSYFDWSDRLISRTWRGFGGRLLREDYATDELGRLLSRTEPYEDGSRSSAATRWSYDGLGRVVSTVHPGGAEWTTGYRGRVTTATDPRGFITETTFNSAGQIVSVEEPENGLTDYSYGPFGSIKAIRDGNGNFTVFSTDAYGRKTILRDPDLGVTTYGYDAFGDLDEITAPIHGTISLEHDALGRLRRRTDPDGVTEWNYDEQPGTRGLFTSSRSPEGHETQHRYDAEGRVASTINRIVGEAALVTEYGYDAYGRMEMIAYPAVFGASFTVKQEHDAWGHPTAVSDARNGTLFWKLSETDLRGRVQREQFGNGVESTRSYDPITGRLLGLSTGTGGVLQALRYGYDRAGNLRYRRDENQTGLMETFRYDGMQRIRSVRFCENMAEPQRVNGVVSEAFDAGCRENVALEYDRIGNLLRKSDVGTYSYDPSRPHAVLQAGPSAFSYDARGNQVARPGATVTYNALDKPRRFDLQNGDVIQFEYDAAGFRVRRTTPRDTTIYAGDLYERSTTANGVEHRHFIKADGRVVAQLSVTGPASSTIRYVHPDHLGSTDVVTNSAGAVVKRLSYDAFGKQRASAWLQGPVAQSQEAIGFTGHESEGDLGLINMVGRFYDPSCARFLTPDPYVQAPFASQSLNRYSYVWNNPLSHTDPTGFQTEGGDEGWVPPYDEQYPDGPPQIEFDDPDSYAGPSTTFLHFEEEVIEVDVPDDAPTTQLEIAIDAEDDREEAPSLDIDWELYEAMLESNAAWDVYTRENWSDPFNDLQRDVVTEEELQLGLIGGIAGPPAVAGGLAAVEAAGLWASAHAPTAVQTLTQLGNAAIDGPVVARSIGAGASAAGLVPELGRKLEYFLGRATGNTHNIQRSVQMLSQLERIGLPDNPATRQYLTEHLRRVLNDPSNIARVETTGRVLRESLLLGPRGGLKFETIWEGGKLITGNLFGGP